MAFKYRMNPRSSVSESMLSEEDVMSQTVHFYWWPR